MNFSRLCFTLGLISYSGYSFLLIGRLHFSKSKVFIYSSTFLKNSKSDESIKANNINDISITDGENIEKINDIQAIIQALAKEMSDVNKDSLGVPTTTISPDNDEKMRISNDQMPISSESIARNKNKAVAIFSSVAAIFLFFFQHTQPASSVSLLKVMAKDSMDINVALCNGKPTIIDFYADWCENCKSMAPTMRTMENIYANKVNFVVVDGGNSDNSDIVSKFRVDGIPHLAFITPKAEVQTALIGAVPEGIIDADIKALILGQELPYLGYDAFEGEESHSPLMSASTICTSTSTSNPFDVN